MTLKLKFDFVVRSRGLTWKFEAFNESLNLKPEVKVWLKSLMFEVLSESLKFEAQLSSLKFEAEV